MTGQADELARQRALLALLAGEGPFALGDSPAAILARAGTLEGMARLPADAAASAGLLAYRRNAQATARRVLRAHFPTIAAMLGEETLDAIALILWRLSPPVCGDLAEWGDALPDLLARHPDLQTWPWLADSARLDWARHQCERAADATLDAASLQRLGDTDPERLQLELVPGLRLLTSSWPLLALWEAHREVPPPVNGTTGDASEADARTQEQARAASTALGTSRAATGLDAGGGTTPDGERHVLVWRGADWRIGMVELAAGSAGWMRMLLAAGQDDSARALSGLLARAPADLDFSGWLNDAVRAGWLWRVGVLPRSGAA